MRGLPREKGEQVAKLFFCGQQGFVETWKARWPQRRGPKAKGHEWSTNVLSNISKERDEGPQVPEQIGEAKGDRIGHDHERMIPRKRPIGPSPCPPPKAQRDPPLLTDGGGGVIVRNREEEEQKGIRSLPRPPILLSPHLLFRPPQPLDRPFFDRTSVKKG